MLANYVQKQSQHYDETAEANIVANSCVFLALIFVSVLQSSIERIVRMNIHKNRI